MDVSVVIVNWNSKDYLRSCLESIYSHLPHLDFEIIVVDGGSFDGCGEMLSAQFPSVVFVQSAENLGFARANNLAARKATGRYLLLLNPDTLFIQDCLTSLVAALNRDPDAGAVGCRLLNADGSIQTTSVLTFPTIWNRIFDSEHVRRSFARSRFYGTAALHSGATAPVEVQAVSGACILVKRELFEKVGGFTESYFMYCEDVDLCYKLWNIGKKVLHVPTEQLIHFGGGSSSKAASNFSNVIMRQSWFQFIRNHQGRLAAYSYRAGMALSALGRLTIIPFLLPFRQGIVRHGPASLSKWWAIFRWSVGFDPKRRRATGP